MRIAIAATGAVLLLAARPPSPQASAPSTPSRSGRCSTRRCAASPPTRDGSCPPRPAWPNCSRSPGQLWLVMQCRAAVHHWWPDLDPETRARARAAADDLTRDARGLPGVRDTRVRLTGTVDRPRLRLTVSCAGDTLVSEVYGELGAGPVERYRDAVGMPDLPVVIRFHPQTRRRHRRPHPKTA
ncbi:hypothetical protein LUX57_39080 [Actinomadura madurae]|uniref:hypothetical protein n=1 Tax=Actinomadura madurae TaxID=1993 RepID=UPI0020D25445|nr:hypothetical protein [Actinomadura madurae]MCP9970447.1 hypothetical protein [Actinomadura madurae]